MSFPVDPAVGCSMQIAATGGLVEVIASTVRAKDAMYFL
jgi:hypothetical protein